MSESIYPVIYHIIKGKLVEISSAIFADGDSYIVVNPPHIWIWIGNKSTIDEKFAAAEISQNDLIEEYEKCDVRSIEQGNEPGEFLDIFVESIKFVEGDVHTMLKHPKKID